MIKLDEWGATIGDCVLLIKPSKCGGFRGRRNEDEGVGTGDAWGTCGVSGRVSMLSHEAEWASHPFLGHCLTYAVTI